MNVKGLIVLLGTTFLTGCSPDLLDMVRQEYICRNDGGVEIGLKGDKKYSSIRAVQCMNGEMYLDWDTIVVDKDYLESFLLRYNEGSNND